MLDSANLGRDKTKNSTKKKLRTTVTVRVIYFACCRTSHVKPPLQNSNVLTSFPAFVERLILVTADACAHELTTQRHVQTAPPTKSYNMNERGNYDQIGAFKKLKL